MYRTGFLGAQRRDHSRQEWVQLALVPEFEIPYHRDQQKLSPKNDSFVAFVSPSPTKRAKMSIKPKDLCYWNLPVQQISFLDPHIRLYLHLMWHDWSHHHLQVDRSIRKWISHQIYHFEQLKYQKAESNKMKSKALKQWNLSESKGSHFFYTC